MTDFIALAQDRAAAEVELVARVLALPRFGAVVAAEAGITPQDFDQPDLQLLYCACEVAAERRLEKIDTLKLARRALRADGFWDDAQIAANALTSMRHSDATLPVLATCRPWCPARVREAAGHLLSVIARQRRAAAQEAP